MFTEIPIWLLAHGPIFPRFPLRSLSVPGGESGTKLGSLGAMKAIPTERPVTRVGSLGGLNMTSLMTSEFRSGSSEESEEAHVIGAKHGDASRLGKLCGFQGKPEGKGLFGGALVLTPCLKVPEIGFNICSQNKSQTLLYIGRRPRVFQCGSQQSAALIIVNWAFALMDHTQQGILSSIQAPPKPVDARIGRASPCRNQTDMHYCMPGQDLLFLNLTLSPCGG